MGRWKSDGIQVPGSRGGRFGGLIVSLCFFFAGDFVIAASIDLMSPTTAQKKTAAKKTTTKYDGINRSISKIMMTEV